jgi:purine-binding chemotaxis protein CheW
MERQLVVFELANEHYGVDIAAVESIIKMQDITVVPHTPDYIEGVTNLRGTVLPVVDLRTRFGLPRQEATHDTRIVVVDVGGTKVGMVVDAVTEVLRVSSEAIEPPSSLVMSNLSSFINGIAKVDSRLVILIDVRKAILTEEMLSGQAEA